jgi:hypothetical protein
MEDFPISMTAIIIATVANFFLSFLWYAPLFGRAWARELGLDTSNKPTGGQMAKGLIFTFIGNLLLAFVFAHNNAAWTFVPGIKEMSPVQNIMNSVVFTWLGFFVPGELSRVGWEGRSWKFFFINTGYYFMMLLVAAVILYYVK